MEMQVEQRLSASKEKVWAALNDTETLKASIPGCDVLDATSDTSFAAQITAKVGPVKAKFKFDVTLSDIDAPNSYVINGKGQGGAAGFANGSAAVSLREDGDGTILAYHAKAQVGGKLAQLGSRLIDGTAQKMADEFFGTFATLVSEEAGDEAATEVAKHSAPAVEAEVANAGKQSPGMRVVIAGVAIAAVVAYLILG